MGRDIEVKVLCICPMGSKRRDMEVKIFYICPMDSETREVEIKIFCICPVRYIMIKGSKGIIDAYLLTFVSYNMLNSLTDPAGNHRIVHGIQMNSIGIVCQQVNNLA